MWLSASLTALLMGVVGGPHCIAMCGAACAGIGRVAGRRSGAALCAFQGGRVIGYALLGALAAGSMQGLGWLTVHSAALRPLWSLFHVATVALGLVLLWSGRQPQWLEVGARSVWRWAKGPHAARGGVRVPLALGVVWALLPCGLLYSALLLATLSAEPMAGATIMASFALGTAVTMLAGPWLWSRFSLNVALWGDGRWGVRLAGAALAGVSAAGLWTGLMHNQAPWCSVG